MKNTLNEHVMPTIDQNEIGCSSLRSDHGPAAPTKTQRTPINAKTEARKMLLALQMIRSGMWDFRKKLSIRKTAHNARNQRTVDLEATYIFTEGPNYSVGD
jgi:hypothetical protein